jgi:RecA/RadA recombinase
LVESGDDFTSALKLLERKTNLSTGSRELDRLLGNGLELGVFYLFYGETESGIDLLIHQLMVSALTGDEDSRVVYLNCGNYREDKTILDIPSLVYLLKARRLDPKEALERIVILCAFSEEQQEQVVEEVRGIIEQTGTIRLIAIHDTAKLFTSQGRGEESYRRIPRLQRAMSRLWQVCAARGVAVVASCRPVETRRGRLPRPEGGRYISHLANVIVYLEKARGLVSSHQAYLLKHSALPPRRVMLGVEGERIMGRITVPFKMRFEEELESLKSYRDALRDLEKQAAYDAIIKACTSEQGAMANTDIPAILDAMLLTGVVDNRRRIDRLEKRFDLLEESVRRLGSGHAGNNSTK